MLVLITGSNGFIGKNIKKYFSDKTDIQFIDFNKQDNINNIDLKNIDFVIHLASVHRSDNIDDFKTYNVNFTRDLINKCSQYNIPIIYTSSIQSNLDTPYGRSKKECMEMVLDYIKASPYSKIFNLTNTFGRFSVPNHLSVVSTFCYNISHSKDIVINNPNCILNLIYIDDVVDSIIKNTSYTIEKLPIKIKPEQEISLVCLADLICKIKNGDYIDDTDWFVRGLKTTYNYFKEMP